MHIKGIIIDKITGIKFLGVFLSQHISNISYNVERIMTSFLIKFNQLYYRFSYLNMHLLWLMFHHRAIYRICNTSSRESNHGACDFLEKPISKHLLARRSFDMCRRLDYSESVPDLRSDFYSSNLARSVRNVFHEF